MRLIQIITFALLLSLGCGCRPSGEDFIISIPAEFAISAREALGPSPRQYEIAIFGLKKQPCIGASLEHSWAIDMQGGHLNIQGYHLPFPCSGPDQQVITRIPLSWSTPGDYPVSINLNNSFFNPGNLLISHSDLTLKMFSLHGITVDPRPVQQLPEDLLWGYLTSDNPDQIVAIEDFLSQWPGESSLHLSGSYGHFSISTSGELALAPVASHSLTHQVPFLRKGIDRTVFTASMNAFIQASNGQITGVLLCPNGQLIQ